MDAPAVLNVERSTGLGFWVAGADYDAIVDGLKPACYKLLSVSHDPLISTHRFTLGRKVQPA